jgi:hypothetical protein
LITSTPATQALWLETLNRICGRAAHELKGAMNGVSVNVEVVRSRAAKPDLPASALATYANAASAQFDAVMDMTEGLLFLARAGSGPTEVGRTVRAIASLLAPVARVDGGDFDLDGTVDAIGAVAVDAGAVRLAIGAALVGMVGGGRLVTVRAENGQLKAVASAGDGSVEAPGDEVIAAAKDAGIEIQAEGSAISITFPR